MNVVTPKGLLTPGAICALPTPLMSWPERVAALTASNAQLQAVIERQATVMTALDAENAYLYAQLLHRSWLRRLIAGFKRAI